MDDTEVITVITRPKQVPVTIRVEALSDLPTAMWSRGRSGTSKALSRYFLKADDLLIVTEYSGRKLLKQVIGRPEQDYEPVGRVIGVFANVRDPSVRAIRAQLPKDAWSISDEVQT